ncbi:Imm26 family immunity protein [Actinophytocola glycyrrhizae]|uniref:Imm26 family immunity protein n=1 Tax=Actinophytocola glycyrrhizae TaxID=2044873 RepID=A0ABV9RUJ7_9PSEU
MAVPLRDEGYVVGIVAQADGAGGVTSYFFGPRRLVVPEVVELASSLRPSDAIHTCNYGDPGLADGKWSVIGGHEEWEPDNWPVPVFGYIEGPGRLAWKVTYKDDNLTEYATREQITVEECLRLPKTGVSGSGAVEKALTHLLNGGTLYDPRVQAYGGTR